MKLLLFLLMSASQLYAQAPNPDLPAPELLTKKYLEELSKRELGQNQFVIKNRDWQQQQQQQQQQEQSGDREIQESDIYKIGHKGQKELFLLNNYRGFQVISFRDGLSKPKLVGRLPVYNNWSSEMYFLEAQNRVVIINTEWSYGYNYWNSNYSTKVYMVDVSNIESPKVVSEETVPGYLESSRVVGDVLYTITNNGNWSQTKARITSLKIQGDKLSEVDSEELQSEDRWVKTMNVVQNENKFYVISTTTNWSGGDRVNVHDITSAKGEITKVFTAKARGTISERSETFIHKGYLFAVSNYRSEGNIGRISVEAYPMKSTTELIESAANMRASIGDTNGLHASLQEVRVSGDLLYAFWVPANNIDPFELFDISEPSKGFKHLGQLQFDGWISKAFPIEFNNRKFVIGLGWVVPATSETSQRYPQAKLFEIKNVNGVYKHEVVGSLTIDNERYWANMNEEDKYFEILQDSPGVFNIMFPVTYLKNWKDGAKIVNADLNTLTLSEGASVVGQQGWLRRIFINKEIQGLHAFDDSRLESFDQRTLSSPGVAKTVSVLELARNIVDFHVLSATEGYQIVNGDGVVELRRVSLKKTDAEKDEILDLVKIDGEYSWHMIKNNKLFTITTFYKPRALSDGYYWDRKFDHANFNVMDLATGVTSVEQIDLKGLEASRYFYFNVENISSDKNELFNISGKTFILTGTNLSQIQVARGCEYFFNQEDRNFEFLTLGGEIYAYNAFDVKPHDSKPSTTEVEYTYSFPFYKKLAFNGQVVTCSESTNAPGKPALIDGNFVVTSEGFDHYYDYDEYGQEDEIEYAFFPSRSNTSKSFSLKMNGSQLELVDVLNKNLASGVTDGGFLTFSPRESRIDIWFLDPAGQFMSRPQYLDYDDQKNVSLVTVEKLNGRNFVFLKNKNLVDVYELLGHSKLKQLSVTSSFDSDLTDDSAENIFEIETITATKDSTRFFVSQGDFGMSDIYLK